MTAMAQDGILTILINSYEEITLMLQYLYNNYITNNVFISGGINRGTNEIFHLSFVRLCGRLLKKFNRTIQNKNDLIQQTDSEVFTNIKI